MYIYCNFELFDAYRTIFVIDETGKKTKVDCVDQAFFPQAIIKNCEEYKTNQIKLSGSKSFLKPIVEDVLTYAKMKYSNRDYEIEVI